MKEKPIEIAQVKQTLKRFSRKVAIGGLGLLFGLIIAEVMARLFLPLMPPGVQAWVELYTIEIVEPRCASWDSDEAFYLYRYYRANHAVTFNHPEYNFTLDTSGLTFGRVGFRDDGITGEPYAVAVGDSFVMSWGVDTDQTWVELVEELLGQDVADLGIANAGARTATQNLIDYGLPLQPKLVLFGLYLNDFNDEAQNLEKQETALLRFRLQNFARRVSYLYRLFSYAYYHNTIEENATCSYQWDNLDYTFSITGWQHMLDLSNPAIVQGMQKTFDSIHVAHQASEDIGAQFVVIIFPTKEQLYLDAIDQGCVSVLSPELFQEPIEQVEEFCRQEGINCLNLGEAIRANDAEDQQIYYTLDAHWNAVGNRLGADLIYSYLVENNLTP